MTPAVALAEMDQLLADARAALDAQQDFPEFAGTPPTVAALLRLAMKNELEATDLAAAWIPLTAELDVKLGFARQVADESRHYQLLAERARALGDERPPPAAVPYSPLTAWLLTLPTTVERLAAGQYAREALAVHRNRQFIAFCRAQGDEETARLYEERIQPDEEFHHALGRRLLAQLLTPDHAAAARAAVARTLATAEELRTKAARTCGEARLPGC